MLMSKECKQEPEKCSSFSGFDSTGFKDYFFDKKKVQLFFTLEFHAAVRGE
jgi:hypothetical protein